MSYTKPAVLLTSFLLLAACGGGGGGGDGGGSSSPAPSNLAPTVSVALVSTAERSSEKSSEWSFGPTSIGADRIAIGSSSEPSIQ